jgi:adenylosuccinate lyase
MPIVKFVRRKMYDEISPLDGRYKNKVEHLSKYFSEFALMKMRVTIELRYLLALDGTELFDKLSSDEKKRVDQIISNFSERDYLQIKEIESTLNHDVKACEVFLRRKLSLSNNNMIHFGLTSEDVNNLAYSLLLKQFLEEEQLPQIKILADLLYSKVEEWKEKPFPARTHGQIASPTTAGKEIAVYLSRLIRQYLKLKSLHFKGKLNGATGNYSAMHSAFPNFDWIKFSEEFIKRLNIEPNLVTTQIEDHDTWSEYFSTVRRINNIILALDLDMWLYLTLGYLAIIAKKEEVGSSTMPHKVNPINFENSEGNLKISNSLLIMFEESLSKSRLQRDLSDSTITRNIGVGLTHSYLAIQETIKGLNKLRVNEKKCLSELNEFPEILAEPIQTILRREGVEDPYDMLKELTRGKRITIDDISKFVDSLKVSESVKNEMKSLDATQYIGEAKRICDIVLEKVKEKLEQDRT